MCCLNATQYLFWCRLLSWQFTSLNVHLQGLNFGIKYRLLFPRKFVHLCTGASFSLDSDQWTGLPIQSLSSQFISLLDKYWIKSNCNVLHHLWFKLLLTPKHPCLMQFNHDLNCIRQHISQLSLVWSIPVCSDSVRFDSSAIDRLWLGQP